MKRYYRKEEWVKQQVLHREDYYNKMLALFFQKWVTNAQQWALK